MIRHELNLLQDYRNIDKLNHRLEFKVIDAVSLYENYEEDELQRVIKPLIETKPSLITEALKRQDALIRDYWSALSYAQSIKNQSSELIVKWKQLENQSIFIRPYLEIGRHYQKLDNNQKACQYYEKCIKTFRESEKAYFLKGKLLLRIGKEEEGINLLKIGSSISKNSSQAYEILGNHWERTKQHQEAIKMFEIVQKINPSKQNQEKIENQKRILRKQEEQRRQQKLRRQEHQRRQEQLRKEKQQKIQAQLKEQEKVRRQEQQRRQERLKMQEMQEIQRIQAQFRDIEKKPKLEQLRRSEEVELKKHKSAEQTDKKNKNHEEGIAESSKKMTLIEKSRKYEKQPQSNKVINQKSYQNPTVKKLQRSPKKLLQMTFQERQIQQILEQRIRNNKSQSEPYFQMIEFLKGKATEKEVLACVQELIKNCRRQKQFILPICKKLQQLYSVFERKRKVTDAFQILQKVHKNSIFGYLYQTYLCIINENREEAAAGIKTCKIVIFVDEWLTQQTGDKHLLENYVFLFYSLIAKENMDLSSLQPLFKVMLSHFEDYYNKKALKSSSIVNQLILMKNLVVQSTFITPHIFLFLQGVDQQVILQYSTQILVKEEMAYIVRDSKELKRLLAHDCSIVAFPSTLTQLALTIENTRLRLKIMVPSIPEEQVKSPVVNAKCKDITGHNGRIRCSEGKPLAQIFEQLIKQSEEK